MDNRLKLHAIFEEILNSRNVYFQPPETIKMKYPAIVYKRDNIDNRHADDTVYMQKDAYEVIVIDPNPDSIYVRKVSTLPMCRYERYYTSDNLNHDVFTIYF